MFSYCWGFIKLAFSYSQFIVLSLTESQVKSSYGFFSGPFSPSIQSRFQILSLFDSCRKRCLLFRHVVLMPCG